MRAPRLPRGKVTDELRPAEHPGSSARTPIEIQIRAALGALAWNVREWRLFRKATLERLAEMAGLGVRHVQKVEAGEANVTLSTLVRLAFALQIDLRDLFAPLRR